MKTYKTKCVYCRGRLYVARKDLVVSCIPCYERVNDLDGYCCTLLSVGMEHANYVEVNDE